MNPRIEKQFAPKDREQRTDLTWSLSAANIDHAAESDRVSVRFANVYELTAWSRVFRKTFGYLPAESRAQNHDHTDTISENDFTHRNQQCNHRERQK